MGLANNRSIAWGIAKAARLPGAEIALTYPGRGAGAPRASAGRRTRRPCGRRMRRHQRRIDRYVFAEVEKLWGGLDFIVHCIAFSDKDELTGRYVDTTEKNFTTSLAISCYSFTAVAQRAEKLMKTGGSMLTLTYYGAEKWMPHYNVMGVAKAALEASVRYLAADLGEKDIRSTPFPPGRSRPSPPPASATSATSSSGTNITRRCAAPSPSRRSAKARCSCCRPWRAASPAKSCTSTPATTSSA